MGIFIDATGLGGDSISKNSRKPFRRHGSEINVSIFMKNLVYILVAILQHCGYHLTAQPSFVLVPVDTVQTSYNSVTSTIHQSGTDYYIYSAGDGNKIDAFKVNDNDSMSLLASYTVSTGKNAVRGLITDTINNQNFLFAGLKGGNAVEVFKISSDGKLKSVYLLPDTDTTYLGTVITLQVVHMQNASYLLAGGLEKTPGLSSFKIKPDGSLQHVQSVKDTEELFTDGIIAMSIHRINSKTYVFTGGFQDNGISGWCLHEDGTLENISNIGDNENRFLNGTYPIISVTKSGWNYVIAGHRHHIYYKPTPWVKDRYTYNYHGDAVSVFRVDDEGNIHPRSVFKDNTETLIRGQTRLQKLPLNDKYDLIAVSTRDDRSIQLFVINENGLLQDAGKIKTGFPIYLSMTGKKIGDRLFLFAGSVEGKEFTSYRLDPK